MMSPYAFHQFWLNVDDAQVGELLRIFTFLSREEIEALEAADAEKPCLRSGAEAPGRRGHDARARSRGDRADAKAAAAALFGGGDLHGSSADTLVGRAARGGLDAVAGRWSPVVDLLVETGLAKSKGEARRTITEGGAYLNNVRVEDPEARARRRPT